MIRNLLSERETDSQAKGAVGRKLQNLKRMIC